MARYHGKKGVIYISTSGSGAAVAAVALNSWSLNMPTDKVEVTAFGDSNKQYVQGLPDATGQLGRRQAVSVSLVGRADEVLVRPGVGGLLHRHRTRQGRRGQRGVRRERGVGPDVRL
jgi:hypothetical protein